ncbi:hypothetical protein DAI22_12g202100 [Oryza sativa Japonica Group]|nr:hypothetical protein DAI22_12g202100 [Oryza sativa Japonica Group]
MRTPKIAAQLPPADLPTGHRRRGWIIWADAPTFSASPTITLAAPPPTMDLNMCRCCRYARFSICFESRNWEELIGCVHYIGNLG